MHPVRHHPRSGIVYLLSLLVVLVVSGIALAMGQGAGQHLRMQQQSIASAQCEAAALGVLRAVCNDLEASIATGLLPQLMTVKAEGELVGDCTVVLVGRDPSGTKLRFGLIPEAGRIDVNALPFKTSNVVSLARLGTDLANGLGMLPGMDPTISAAICDWCDADDTPDANGGAERSDGAYTGAAVPYAPRNGEMQEVEELRLVRGVTDAIYFGEDRNQNGMLDTGEDADADGRLLPGLRGACALYVREPAAKNPTRLETRNKNELDQLLPKLFDKKRAEALSAHVTPPFFSKLHLLSMMTDLTEAEAETLWLAMIGPEGRIGLIDAWSCSDVVLEALVGTELAQGIISARPSTMPTGPLWLVDALAAAGSANVQRYGHLFTVGSYQFRVDLLAVRNDGAGWTRLEAVIDCSGSSATIMSLRPTATHGWPFPAATPEMIRRNQPADVGSFLATGQP